MSDEFRSRAKRIIYAGRQEAFAWRALPMYRITPGPRSSRPAARQPCIRFQPSGSRMTPRAAQSSHGRGAACRACLGYTKAPKALVRVTLAPGWI